MPEAVVLADDQQRERQALVGAVPGGVERAHRGGVVHRGVTQAGHHDRVGGPAAGGAQPGGAAQREGEPDRARQMGGDGRGLRDDVQVGVADHLVPPAGDRLGRRRDQPEQHVAHTVPGRAGAGGAHQVERPGPVVQQRRVIPPQRRRDRRVALVAGGADGVETGLALAQPPRGQVQVTAGELGVEQLQAALPGQRRAGPDGAGQILAAERGRRAGHPQLQDGVGEILLDLVAAVSRVAHVVYGKAAAPDLPSGTGLLG